MSSWKGSFKKKYDEHRHCLVCGVAVPLDKEFCSLECQDKYAGYEKKKSRSNYIQVFVMVAMMIVFIFVLPMLQG